MGSTDVHEVRLELMKAEIDEIKKELKELSGVMQKLLISISTSAVLLAINIAMGLFKR